MFFSSCSSTSEDPIGIWAPIKKTVNGTYIKGNDFNVPKEGGTYKIYSQNYGSPWLTQVSVNKQTIWPDEGDDWLKFREIHLVGDWYELQYDTDGNIVAQIKPRTDEETSRTLSLDLQCGDAFGAILFIQ